MTTTAPMPEPVALSPEQTQNETATSVACDLLERGLQMPFIGLQHVLFQVADSGLIGESHTHRGFLDRIIKQAGEIDRRLGKLYPLSDCGAAAGTRRRLCTNLLEEVDFYRQEIFWTNRSPQRLIESEEMIRNLFRLYHMVEHLLASIEADYPESRNGCRYRVPARPDNRYEQIIPN